MIWPPHGPSRVSPGKSPYPPRTGSSSFSTSPSSVWSLLIPRQPLLSLRMSLTVSTGSPDSPRQSQLVLPTLPDSLSRLSLPSPPDSLYGLTRRPDSLLSLPSVYRFSRCPRRSLLSRPTPPTVYCLFRLSTVAPDSLYCLARRIRQSLLYLPTVSHFSRRPRQSLLSRPTDPTVTFVSPDSLPFLPSPRRSLLSRPMPPTVYCLSRLPAVATDSLYCLTRRADSLYYSPRQSLPMPRQFRLSFPTPRHFRLSLPTPRQLRLSLPFQTFPSVSPIPDSSACLSRSRQFRLSLPFQTVPPVSHVSDSSACLS